MAEMKFNCPKCAQLIACDELWSGHQIQCPTCQAPITVPPQAAAPAAPASKPLVPQVPQFSAPRLSIGQTRHAPSSAPPQASATSTQARVAKDFVTQKKKGGALKTIILILVFVGCAAGGYFGFQKVKEMQDKSNAKAKGDSDGGEFGHAKALYDVLDATDPGKMGRISGPRRGGPPPPAPAGNPTLAGNPANPAAPATPVAVVSPIYTLDTNAIKIPQSRVNGMIAGTNFVSDGARLDPSPSAGAVVLRFYQGQVTSPDRAIFIYLRPKPGEKLAGHTWSVAPETKGGPQIIKMWKPAPTAAQPVVLQPASKTFATGYALDLELDQIAGGQLSGKIFLALPDPEQSVISGAFEAATKLPDTAATAASPTGAAPGSAAAQPRPPGRP